MKACKIKNLRVVAPGVGSRCLPLSEISYLCIAANQVFTGFLTRKTRQVWAAWMSPSHDGYVGPKAISKRTVPLGLMFRCDEGSCFTSTRS